MQAPEAGLLKTLPRRARLCDPVAAGPIPIRRPVHAPPVRIGALIGRVLRWGWVGAATAWAVLRDRRAGLLTGARAGARLREAFERVGGSAVKIGQQLAIRVDLLPFDLCQELALLTDRVAPFPFERAIPRIERAVGGRLEERFEVIDPEPIGAASIACVYRGRLRAAPGERGAGERGPEDGWVAIKVQRPDVPEQFASDILIFDALTRLLEALTVVRPGFFGFLRGEIRLLFSEELDFRIEGRYQRLFRRYVARDHLRWLTCPEVYPALSDDRVLVSEFVSAPSCAEVLAVMDSRDPEGLAALRRMEIAPEVVADRIFYLSTWGRYETPFFHGDPHASNVLVLPGGRLCLLDFGACAALPWWNNRTGLRVVSCIASDAISDAADTVICGLGPLPHYDLHAIHRDIEQAFWRFHANLNNPDASWFDRTSAGLWADMMEVIQRHHVPATSETLRMFRATLLYDTLAARLKPSLSLRDTRRYLREALPRHARRVRRYQEENRRRLPSRARVLLELPRLIGELQMISLKVEALHAGLLQFRGSARLARRAVGLAGWLILAGIAVALWWATR